MSSDNTADRPVRWRVGALVLTVGLGLTTSAQAQTDHTWGGPGATTTTSDYNLSTNWETPPAGAPPASGGQEALFGATGASTITVTAPINPDSWIFLSNAQSYSIGGADVNFGVAGSGWSFINNANSGQTITIGNNLGETVAGVRAELLGNSTTILLGANSYSGGTFIGSVATLQLGDATHTARIIGDVSNFGIFNIVRADTSGIVSLTNDGGTTNFLGASSAGTMTIVNQSIATTAFGVAGGTDTATAGNAVITNHQGRTLFNANTSAGNATITNDTFSMLAFVNAATAANAVITNGGNSYVMFGIGFGSDTPSAGNATITNNMNGQVQFNAHSTAANATVTTNDGGSTLFFDHASAGSATIITNDGGRTRFLDNTTGGTAQFVTNGTGVVDFSGSTGVNGDGRITAGSLAGSGNYYIGAFNTLVVGGNNLSTEVSGVIGDTDPCGCGTIGPGSLTKVGSGKLTLSGVNTYTGTTTIDGGILAVNGSIAGSNVVVNSGGALGGNGIVGSTLINGGALAPGNSIGLLTVQGNLVFTTAASYMVEVSPANADRVNVTGTATLGGATVQASFAPGSYVNKQYTIVNATGGVSGSFNALVNTNLPANFSSSLSYDANNVYLNLTLGSTGTNNTNQQNVTDTTTGYFNRTGGIPLAFGALTPAGLTQVSGEIATVPQQAMFDSMKIFLGLMTDPFVAGRSANASSPAAAFADAGRGAAPRDAFARMPVKATPAQRFDERWSTWAAPFGGGSFTDGNAALGSNNATIREVGLAAGADYIVSPSWLAGFALSGGGTSFGVNGGGSGRSHLFQAGAFARYRNGPDYLAAALAYGWHDVTTDRTVTVAGVDQLRGRFNASAYSARLEAGRRYATPWGGITPYLGGQATAYVLPSYAEQVLSGAGTFALTYAGKTVTDARIEIGARFDRAFVLADGVLSLHGRAAWAHNFNPDRTMTAGFQLLPGTSFVVNGAAQSRDLALTTASAEMAWRNGWSAAATFEGEFSTISRSYAGKGVVRYSW
ncbi:MULTISPECIES: autotransporter domain-containing protein [unclassified Bradyrhizobium]|uniref:autotransporter outer membrane beta-barrel domain-containing protein n=1 Tax=unclassified Bradyrhizobium TaxID=2631580 RepID=UPI0028E4DB6C|nr:MULTISPECIES: autotransporter domain-containing protein [unclassified Bradyrhizobium]